MESCLGPVDIILAVVLPTPQAEGKKKDWEKSLGSTTTLSQSVLSSPCMQGNGVGYLGVCNNIWERVQKCAERLEVGKRGVDRARGKGLGSTGSAGGQSMDQDCPGDRQGQKNRTQRMHRGAKEEKRAWGRVWCEWESL